MILHFNVQFFYNFDFSIFSILPFWGPFCQKKSLIFLHKTSQICLSSRFGGFGGCWFNFCFCEKNRTADLFSGIWPLQRNLERILWVKMTSNLISKSRNGISIPKNPKNDYSKHIWDVFWRNIRDFFCKKWPPKWQNWEIQKIKITGAILQGLWWSNMNYEVFHSTIYSTDRFSQKGNCTMRMQL